MRHRRPDKQETAQVKGPVFENCPSAAPGRVRTVLTPLNLDEFRSRIKKG
jgi:hypothetical protein